MPEYQLKFWVNLEPKDFFYHAILIAVSSYLLLLMRGSFQHVLLSQSTFLNERARKREEKREIKFLQVFRIKEQDAFDI